MFRKERELMMCLDDPAYIFKNILVINLREIYMEITQPLMDKKCNISLYISRVALEKRYKVFIDKKQLLLSRLKIVLDKHYHLNIYW